MARVQVNCDGLGLGNFLEFPGVEDRYPPKLEIMNRDIVPSRHGGDSCGDC